MRDQTCNICGGDHANGWCLGAPGYAPGLSIMEER